MFVELGMPLVPRGEVFFDKGQEFLSNFSFDSKVVGWIEPKNLAVSSSLCPFHFCAFLVLQFYVVAGFLQGLLIVMFVSFKKFFVAASV